MARAASAVPEARIHRLPVRSESARATPTVLKTAHVLSAVIVVLMAAISILGLTVSGLYRDGAWAREAFRGADLVTLALAVPLLAVSLLLARRGSARATAVWLGMLGYSVYNYAFYVFGSNFNDVFPLHILVFSMSLFTLAIAVPNVNIRALGEELRLDRWARWLGGLLVIVGLGQGGLWVFLAVRYAITGELLADIPVRGQHVVFALDLSLMMPALVIGGFLLLRRRAAGFLLGTAVAVTGAVYTVNGLAAQWFQSNAGVPGAEAFAPDGLLLAATMALPALVLLLARREPSNVRAAT